VILLKKSISTILATLTLFLLLSACQLVRINNADEQKQNKPTPPPPPAKVTIAAIGDVMMHEPQIKSGKTKSGYDYRKFFKAVQPYLSNTDLTVANLETTLAGNSKPYSGYPRFNSPDQLLDALKYSGVDIITTANNHSNDTGEKGIIRTYSTIKKNGFMVTGTAPTEKERKGILVEKNGIKLGFLSYTEHTNGLPVAKGKPYLVNLIDPVKIASDIKDIKQQGAEYVLVSLHWGTEYQRNANEKQKKTALKVLQAGADVILGSHPHVQQQIEKMMVNGQEKLVVYSMGNFISNQSDPYTDEGVIVYLDIMKDSKTGKIKLTNTSFIPTLVNKYKKSEKTEYTVVPLPTKTAENIKAYPGLTKKKWEKAWNNVKSIITKTDSYPVLAPKS
jgi:poly-gamma-glutamate capsule biosynthesis protein CapA/YwtB (metallophosphatase superfamily)